MFESYDMIIVGGGPGGATLARIVDQNMHVLLLDGTKLHGKTCGGLLAPDAQTILAHFDLSLPKEVLVDPQIFSVRTIDLQSKLQKRYKRMYINVDRARFDRWLISLIPDNVQIKRAHCFKLVPEKDGFIVYFKNNDGRVEQAYAKQIVGADGANSIVRRSLGLDLKTRNYVAIQQCFVAEESAKPCYSAIFDEKATDCYSWTIYKDGNIIFGGAYPKDNCRERFEQQKLRLNANGFSLHEPIATDACQVLRPTGMNSFCCGKNNVFLLGEAAGFISPSSLEGISSAMKSALALNESLHSHCVLKAYRRNTLILRLKLTAKNLKCPFMYNPLLRRMVMKLGIKSINMYVKEG